MKENLISFTFILAPAFSNLYLPTDKLMEKKIATLPSRAEL